MRDVAGHVVMLLMDVAVKDCDILERRQRVDDRGGVTRRPIPLRVEVEQRPVCEHDDGSVRFMLFEVSLQPGELRLADDGFGIGRYPAR